MNKDDEVKVEIMDFEARNNMGAGVLEITKIVFHGNGEWEFRLKISGRTVPVALKIIAEEVTYE